MLALVLGYNRFFKNIEVFMASEELDFLVD